MNDEKMQKNLLKPVMLLNFAKGLIATPAGFIIAVLTSNLTDNALKGLTHDVLKQAIFFIVFIVIYRVIYLVLDMITGRKSAQSIQNFKLSIYKKFLKQPPWIVSRFTSGRTIESFSDDIQQTVTFYVNILPGLINGVIMLLSYTIYIMTKNIYFAFTLLGIGSIQLLPPIIVNKYMVQNYDDTRKIEAEITEHIISGYKGMETIKHYNLKNWYLNVLSNMHKKYLKIGRRSEATASSQNMMDSALAYILKFGTYGIIGWFILIHVISINTGVQAITLYTGLYSAIKTIFDSIPNISVSKKAEERIKEIIAFFNLNKINVIELNENNPVYDVKNLAFSYENKDILKGIDFKVMKGDIVVIKGANGEGKSTLFDILLGIEHDYQGKVMLYNLDLNNIDMDEYTKYISAIMQRENGFDISPEEFFGKLQEAEILNKKDAIKLAREFGITEEKLINEKILNLSGGEFKKVYIITGLLKKSKVLFLDEPENSLDEDAKILLKTKLLSCGKTIILITHDPYFVDIATCTIELKNGRAIVERRSIYEEAGNN